MLLYVLATIFQYGTILAALLVGGREERIVGAALLVNTIGSILSVRRAWGEPEYVVLALDLAFLALLIIVAMRTLRWWPLWCAAFELLIVVTHVAIMVDPTVRARSYATGSIIWSNVVLATLAVATYAAVRRRGRLHT